MNKQSISSNQLFWMISTMQVGMSILLTLNPATVAAKQDVWISTILSTLFGMAIAFVCSRLSVLYAGESLISFAPKAAGKWIGHFCIFLLMLYWFTVLAIILRQYAEFIIGTILPRTPVFIPIVGMLLVACYVVAAGIEVIGRCAEIFGPLVLIGILMPLLLNLKQLHFGNILPVFVDNGAVAILKGSLPTAAFLSDNIMLLMLFSFLTAPKNGIKSSMLGTGIAGLLTVFAAFECVAIFGYMTASGHIYPFFNLVRYVSFGFFQNMDSLVVAIWIMGVFIKVALYLYVCSFGLSQWFGIKRWRMSLAYIVPLMLLLSMLPRNFVESSVLYPRMIAIPFNLPVQSFFVPTFLWVIAEIRYRNKKTGQHAP
jgi:spore germination protein KB